MKTICTLLLGLSVLFSQCLAENSNTRDLKKNTVKGFIVPYVLRYDPDAWSCIQRNGKQEFSAIARSLEIVVSANKDETNLLQEELDCSFQEAIGERCANKNLYASYEIISSKTVALTESIFCTKA